MTQFTVRVELHDAQWSDYNVLRGEMESQGFSRVISGEDGRSYELPWAEYDYSGSVTSAEVLALAQAAADKTRKRQSILVTEASSRAWSGLPAAPS